MNRENTTIIQFQEESTVLAFAAQELKKYLEKAGVQAHVLPYRKENPYLKQLVLEVSPETFAVSDPKWDDAYEICIEDFRGRIRGSNDRSVLLGAYRYLRELGYYFLRPGILGEKCPGQIGSHTVEVREAPSYRHRGICIEGAVSYENVLDLVDWLPKAGMNSYFTQFLIPHEFFKCWYEHRNNPYAVPEKAPAEADVAAFVRDILMPQIKQRGLIWQAAGHGMTTEAIGISGTGWDTCPQEIVPEECRGYLAEINGKRELFKGAPLNTNLCYSNPEVRERITDGAVRYLERNPEIDVMHFWLADGSNNSCECENCRQLRPADWYVKILNRLDEKLTAKGISTKIVFLSYVDLLWPPQQERLRNPDRFIFMFAPISRSYMKPFPDGSSACGELPPFSRNHLTFPEAVEENFAFLKGWQKLFHGDSFMYEYHYMWNLFRDWGDYYAAKVLWQDIRNLENLGMSGYISCQETRAFAPTGLGMWILAETLWKKEQDFDALVDNYFRAMYGVHAGEVLEYIRELSRLAYEEQPEQDGPGVDKEAAARQEAAIARIRAMRGRLTGWMEQSTGCDSISYRYLIRHGQAAEYYLEAMRERRLGNEDEAKQKYEILKQYLGMSESEWQEGFDVYWFIRWYDLKFRQ